MMGYFDRFSLRAVATDYWRSVRIYADGSPDRVARWTLVCFPLVCGVFSVCRGLQLTTPTAVLPAVALLAGVLLAAAGQVLTMRARIADSLVLSTDKRLTGHVRETMSGLLLAAVAALVDALLLGVLATTGISTQKTTVGVVFTGIVVVVTAYIVLMFVATARRLYATYLEVFEDGNPLPKKPVNDVSVSIRTERIADK